MAKRKAPARTRTSSPARTRASKVASAKRVSRRSLRRAAPAKHAKTPVRAKTKAKATKTASKRRSAPPKAPARARATTRPTPQKRSAKAKAVAPAKTARLDRVRKTLEDTVQTPPSSLDMNQHGTAARTGRAELAERRRDQKGMSPEIAGGDVDVNVEDAYFTGDEAPGGDNPTPDQEVVDDIGKALGVEYDDNEELKSVGKVEERDRNRWELDPASAEDYKKNRD